MNWAPETSRALKEKYQTEVSGWQALTGAVIDPKRKSSANYHRGPSSNYGSDSGAGYSGCGASSYGCFGGI